MTLVAGQKLRVSDLSATPGASGGGSKTLGSDLTANNTTTFANVTGLAVDLVANARYAFDGWMMWNSDPSADIKFGWTVPSGGSGWWCAMGPVTSTAPNTGEERKNYTDFGTVPIGTSATLAGDDTAPSIIRICATLRGTVVTSTAGTLQLKFAQSSAVASDTILRAGSWLNVFRVA